MRVEQERANAHDYAKKQRTTMPGDIGDNNVIGYETAVMMNDIY
jgi:hypothetical protein